MILAITGSKGGASKSTLAINIAAELHRRRCRVLLVDADPQGTASTWVAVAAEQQRPAPTLVAMGATMAQADQLPRLAAGFDHIIIDGPPRLGEVQRAMMLVATCALLPCVPSTRDVWAMSEALELVKEARARVRPDLVAAVMLVRTQPRASITRLSRAALQACGLPVLAAELGQRVAFPQALAAGLGVTEFDPEGRAAEETRALVDELLSLSPPRRSRRKNGAT